MSAPTDTASKLLKNLEPRQRKFVGAYCRCFNATQAAISAGYSKKTARSIGSENLTKPDIKNAIAAVFATSSMEPEEIAARWTALARAGLDDFYTQVEVEVKTKVAQPLAEAIAQVQKTITFEHKYAQRVGLSGKELKAHQALIEQKRRQIVRWELELEEDPAATRLVDGPSRMEKHMQLDLMKAADLGLLDMVKAIVPTEFGTKIELRSPDAALDNLAKWRGMLTTKIDLTSKGEQLAAPPLLGVLTLAQKKELLEARRKLAQQQGGGANG